MATLDLDSVIDNAENPEKALEQTLTEMQDGLIQLNQAMDRATAFCQRTEQQYNKNIVEASTWHQRAELAASREEKELAQGALARKKILVDAAIALKNQMKQYAAHVAALRQNITTLESKILEAESRLLVIKGRRLAEAVKQQSAEPEGVEARLHRVERELEMMQTQLQKLLDCNSAALREVRELLKASHPQSAAKIAIFSNTQVFGMRKPEITAKKLQL